MAVIAESATYEPTVYELELTDPVEGGPAGKSNTAAQQLANRTKWLNENKLGNGSGSAAAPGWAFKAEPALGMYRPSAGVLAFTDGVEQGRMSGGIFAWRTTFMIGANDGDMVFRHATRIRAVNEGETNADQLIGLSTAGVVIANDGLNVISLGAPATVIGAALGDSVMATQKALRGANGAGTAALNIGRVDAGSQVEIGHPTAQLVFSFFNPATGATQSGILRTGAVDSGEPGYRQLMLPN